MKGEGKKNMQKMRGEKGIITLNRKMVQKKKKTGRLGVAATGERRGLDRIKEEAGQ